MDPRVTLKALPAHCLSWLAGSRARFLEDLKGGKPLRYFAAHLPVMATWREGEPFPVNMTVKGIGLVPREGLIRDYTDVFEGAIAEARGVSWRESLPRRVAAAKSLYGDEGNFDPAVLGGLEIFEGRALENLRADPRASLLYVGMDHSPEGVRYISFQVNGRVEILGKEDPRYRFLLASRRLFEFESFHLYQPDYPFGYLIRVDEVRDKSPWSRGAGGRHAS
ncbi:MAG: hypothetical protein Kow0025_13950 [Thermodesulfovibrionales bacterium]